MRPIMLSASFLALLSMAPLVPADTMTGGAYGFRSGDCDVGGWDLFFFQASGGKVFINLTWADGPLFIDADYDLLVYNYSAYSNDGALTERPWFASEGRSFTNRFESIGATLPAGRYVIAVVPHQAQGDRYTLSTTSGVLTDTYPPAPGVRGYTPIWTCVL